MHMQLACNARSEKCVPQCCGGACATPAAVPARPRARETALEGRFVDVLGSDHACQGLLH